jgi:hypothetical protein
MCDCNTKENSPKRLFNHLRKPFIVTCEIREEKRAAHVLRLASDPKAELQTSTQ